MAYAQKNYPQNLGYGPSVGSIALYGCLLTSISNLLGRSGRDVDPLTLNQQLIDRGLYMAERDGTRDLLGFGTPTQYDSNIVITSAGKGWPSSPNSIVKFVFHSKGNPANPVVTHFCLVADPAARTIVDSYDGVVRAPGYYGEPVEYASYGFNSPQPVVVAGGTANQPAFAVEDIVQKNVQLKLQPTHKWDMNRRDFEDMAHNPVEDRNAGDIVTVSAIAHHSNGYSYYLESHDQTTGFNVLDCADYVDERPISQKEYTYVRFENPITVYAKLSPTNIWDLNYTSYADAHANGQLQRGDAFVAVGKAVRNTYNKDVYFMDAESFGEADAYGSPAIAKGVNTLDLTDVAPVESNKVAESSAVQTEQAPATPVNTQPAPSNPDSWKTSFKTNCAGKYTAKVMHRVADLEGKYADVRIVAGQRLDIAGQFAKGGSYYYRTAASVKADNWYGIPVTCIAPSDSFDEKKLLDGLLKQELQEAFGHLTEREIAIARAGAGENVKALLSSLGKILTRK